MVKPAERRNSGSDENARLIETQEKYRFDPHKCLNQVRIQRSERTLKIGIDLSEIAYRESFPDQSHVTRMLESIKEVTPGAYRNFGYGFHR